MRLGLWWLAVAVWTLGLLTPHPVRLSKELFTASVGFSLAKALHVSAYAVLTACIPWLGLRRGRWWLLVFLSFHAAATEFLQQWVPERTASLRDVGLDHLGILLGLLGTWRLWSVKRPHRRDAEHRRERPEDRRESRE